MHKNLLKLYPDTIIQENPNYNDQYYCYYDKSSKQYFSIPKSSITEREQLLLETMYTLVEQTPIHLNAEKREKTWYEFLMNKGKLPEIQGRIRFIHFYAAEISNHHDFLVAAKSFAPDRIVFVWLDKKTGVIIEKESPEILSERDLSSFYDAILSDFYMKVEFYIGRFFEATPLLKEQFNREQYYFKVARKIYPQRHVYSFIHAFPIVIMSTEWNQLIPILEQEYRDIFRGDQELVKIIKKYLENNSNASLSAKELYMHRNSLQYKIDKFIEHSNIDIKTFQGAIAVYFIIIFGDASFYFKWDQ